MGKNTIYRYSPKGEDIYEFLYRVSNLDELTDKVIYFSIPPRGVLVGGITSPKTLMAQCDSIDIVSMICKFRGKPCVVGGNMKRNEIFITVRNREPIDLDSLERVLFPHGS